MRTATVRDLRNNFASLESWLADGEGIQIEKRGTPVAMLTPATQEKSVPRPDAAARRKAIWGDRCFTAEEVKEMREYELKGEQG